MRYALLAFARPGAFAALTAEEHAAWAADDAGFAAALDDHAAMVWGEPLAEPETATTVRIDDGRAVLTDGPPDGGGHVMGMLVVEAPDLDAALALARRWPAARTGAVEVRPVRDQGR